MPQGSEWPSDDSADEDYDPDKEDSAAKGEDSEGEKTVPGAGRALDGFGGVAPSLEH